MKISNAFFLKTPVTNFKKTVDYGSKDNDLIYVPILFEEQDTFQPSFNEENPDSNNTYKPNKLKTLLTTGGGILAGIEVLPDAIDRVVNRTANVAKNSMEQIKSVKDTYTQTFQNDKEKADTEHTHIQHDDEDEDYSPYDTLNNSDNDKDITNDNIDTDNTDVDDNDYDDDDDSDDDIY